MVGSRTAGPHSSPSLSRLAAGLTTNEVHKRRQLALARQLEAEQQQMEARVEAALAGRRTGSSGSLEAGAGAAAAGATGAADGSAACQQRQQQQRSGKRRPQISLPNHYNRGAWRNLSEVLFPEFHLRQAAAVAAANGGSGSSPAGGKKRS